MMAVRCRIPPSVEIGSCGRHRMGEHAPWVIWLQVMRKLRPRAAGKRRPMRRCRPSMSGYARRRNNVLPQSAPRCFAIVRLHPSRTCSPLPRV
jgi:hypothetical protein